MKQAPVNLTRHLKSRDRKTAGAHDTGPESMALSIGATG